MVNAVARYPRSFTVTAFTLLMGFNWVPLPLSALVGARISAFDATFRAPMIAATDQGRRNVRNFSRNRPETRNLNHQ